jgi:histidyl-tRNA synthetase
VGLDVFIVSLGDAARERAFELAYDMRRAGLAVDFDMIGRGLKAQMRYADKMKARFVAIIGDDELAAGEATVKDMSTGEQIRVAQAGLVTCMRRQ